MNEKVVMVDAMDWALLTELQKDARLSYNELSRRVHLSPPAVADRVRRLEERGVISGYHAHVDLAAVDRTVVALTRMACYGARCVLLDPTLPHWPEVLEIHRVTGNGCSVIKVAAPSVEAFEKVLTRLVAYGIPTSMMILSSPLPWRPVTPT